ncbi:cation diffusion facilitator transporter [Thalassobacillus devorans]|uniref:Cation diffusion facilitator transporter n=1 Tax=Thalassobacillus devorans TaxID=279813 RepID=A0ABQ1NP83_9BACI|nr:cation diffusion facilitator family transporter [Thalassobacillus devorans]NIK28978.1 cation diffusion facilitator family transporter [Thalassobacillus devorans]GGC82101.1 cation diffusion facilitator transporter [Thalassobacillus devorans]
MALLELLKKGNKSSGVAALGNTGLAIIKSIAAAVSGSGAMMATAIHSIADATNQGLVYFGSALAEKEPTKRFPTGFGRVVNLFVLLAVIIIGIMAYETILKGWEIIQHPKASTSFWLNVLILVASIAVDGFILIKAMKEVVKESRVDASGMQVLTASFKNVKYAAPPTKLVFYEDIIATSGAVLALISVVLAHFTGLYILDGIGTMLIGVLLIIIALMLGYENTMGLIGAAAPEIVENRIASIILADKDVEDIKRLRIIREGDDYHVDGAIELRGGLTLAEADDIKYRVRDSVLEDPDVDDVVIGIIETDKIQNWEVEDKKE